MADERRVPAERRKGTDRRYQFERREPGAGEVATDSRGSERRGSRERRRFRDRRRELNCPHCGLWAQPYVRCPKCGKSVCPTCLRIGWMNIAERSGGWAIREILLVCTRCYPRMPEDLRSSARATKGQLAEWLGVSRPTLDKLIGIGCCTIAGG